MNKIRILYAMGGNMHRAGAETMIMNYVRQLVNYDLFDISILVHGYDSGDYDDELMSIGVKIIRVPIRSRDPIKYSEKIKLVLSEGKYKIVHCNMDASSGDFLEIAKKCNIPVRIAHAHTTKYLSKNIIKKIIAINSKRKITKVATHFLACSQKAGDWMFGKANYIVVNNAIDLEKYRYNEAIRKRVRNNLELDSDMLVLGHVGRFCYEKNHEGLIEIFSRYHEHNEKSVLLCVGEGPTKELVMELVKSLGIEDNVRFLGVRSDINELMQAMDLFLLPSLFEGLPVVGIEAQASGLPCLFSDAVTNEVCLLENSRRLSINNVSDWTNEIEHLKGCRSTDISPLMKAGYSIQNEAKKLSDFYLKCLM